MNNKCPVCGFETKIFAKLKNHIIYKCKNCGFGFTTNLSAHLGNYHRDDTYIQEEKLFENIFSKRVSKILNFKTKGDVLDIGCSTGLFLSLFQKKGWNVTGVEISKKAAEVAEKRGVEVLIKPFEEIRFTKKFDLIVLNHTLEHLKDPFDVVKKASQLLKPGGLLYIDLPNFASLSASIYKKNWTHLLPDEHLWHFTYKSLEIMLQKLGLKIIFVERSSGIWDVNKPYLELLTSLVTFKKRFFFNLLSALPTLLISKINLGSDLMVIAKKDE